MNLLYYIHGALVYLSFIALAAKWKELVKSWEEVELALLDELDEANDPFKLKRKIKKLIVLYTVLAIIAQVLHRVNEYRHSLGCEGFDSLWHAFFNRSYPELFFCVPYNEVVAVVACISSTMCDLARVYLDLLLSVLCLALIELFELFNRSIMVAPIEVGGFKGSLDCIKN